MQIGDSCVLRPPPPPPPPVVQTFVHTAVVAVGGPCFAATQCVAGAVCSVGVCRCGVGYYMSGNGCLYSKLTKIN